MVGIPILHENSLLETSGPDHVTVVRRVLRLDPHRGRACLIDVQDEKAMPEWVSFEQLGKSYEDGGGSIRDDDPWLADSRADGELTAADIRVRDHRWKAIGPLVDEAADADRCILERHLRGAMVMEAHISTRAAQDKIYEWLRRYWRGGQTRNALLSGYHRSGTRLDGKPRAVGPVPPGRPSKRSMVDGVPDTLRVTPEVRAKLVKGGQRYWATKDKQKRKLKDAYRRTMADFFAKRIELRDGVFVPVVWETPEDDRRLPTYRQFCYWLAKSIRVEDALKARFGEKVFNLKHRAVLGTSEGMSRGPGHLYQGDATVADLHLLSAIDARRTIGRPVLYLIVDHFSRMIVGYHVGLEGPSWAGARMALENAFTDKVAHCARYGIEISHEDWPCDIVCRKLLGDRGEWICTESDAVGARLGFEPVNTPPYRGDLKALVEGQFKLSHEQGIKRVPGSVDKHRDRGDGDYRYDAILNLRMFNRLMITIILHNNNSRRLQGQVPQGFPRSEDDLPTPIDLWTWGMENQLGLGRKLPRDVIRANLLPRFRATAQREGLTIRNGLLRYASATALEKGWFLGNTGIQSQEVELALDERDVTTAFLLTDRDRTVEVCTLEGPYQRFRGMSLADVEDDHDRIQLAGARGAGRKLQDEVAHGATVEAIVTEAKKERTAQLGPGSHRADPKGSNDARRAERDHERKVNAFTRQPDDDGVHEMPTRSGQAAPYDDEDGDDCLWFPS